MNADFEIRDRTVTMREFAVKTPLDWKNFNFVIHRVAQHLEAAGRVGYDDACEVTVGDDEIIFSWELADETVKAQLP